MTTFNSTEIPIIEDTEEMKPPALTRSLTVREEDLKDLPPLPDDAVEGGAWTSMDELAIIDMFSELSAYKEGTGKVEWDKLDYDVYGEDYYREKYPHFPDEFYPLMVRASRKKYEDLRKENTSGVLREEGNFVVSFE